MVTARHPRPSELSNATLEEIEQKNVAQFRNRVSDWEAFEDAKVEGFKRDQHRLIGAGGYGKVGDDSVIPARGFNLSIIVVNPGQGNDAHTTEVDEVFFVLQGFLYVFPQVDSVCADGTRV